jgi:hypothetical protein
MLEPSDGKCVVDCIVLRDDTDLMFPLLRFHLRVGIRLAIRSFAPLFAGFLAVIILQMYPAAFVRGIAAGIYGKTPDPTVLLGIAALSLGFSFSAAPRLEYGLNGWMRHLSISSAANRRGLTLALITVQAPLILTLVILGYVARAAGVNPWGAIDIRLGLVFASSAIAALPVKRRFVPGVLALSAACMAIWGTLYMLLAAGVLLVTAEISAGELRKPAAQRPRRMASALFSFQLAQRALAWGILGILCAAAIPLGVTMLFLANNPLPDPLVHGAARLGGCVSVLFSICAGATRLAVRRPVWPWARSLPWSAGMRILSDAAFLTALSLPALVVVAALDGATAVLVAAVAPLLALRSTEHVRRNPDRRVQAAGMVLEGLFVSALVCLVPWTAAASLAGAVPAFLAAKNAELALKATRWSERYHLASGDSLSWSA